MSGTDLRELLKNRAAGASMPPADLMDRVEAGYRRRRRGQVAWSAFAAVLVLAVAVWAGLSPAPDRTSLPANLVNPSPFHLPPTLNKAPGLSSAFPDAVLDGIPPTTPSNSKTAVLGRLGRGHALLGDRKALYDYDTRSKTFRTITETGGAMTAIAIAPHWIVWQQTDSANAEHFFVYRAPISGGPRQLVAAVGQRTPTTIWYATDDDVYWTSLPTSRAGSGVTRLSLKNGAVSTMPGFEDLSVDGTPWAKGYDIPTVDNPGVEIPTDGRTTLMRNLLTGERRSVTTRDDTEWLRCVATFCVGQTRSTRPSPTTPSGQAYPHMDGYFLQQPDGSDRVEISYRAMSPQLLRTDDGGLLAFQGATVTVLDPVSGKVGTIAGAGKGLGCASTGAASIEWSNYGDPGREDCSPAVHVAFFN
jgi:hypothetical protein